MKRDDAGLPATPSGADRAGLAWVPGADGRWTAAVTLPAGTDVAGLDTGAAVVLTDPDGTRTELTVRSRSTVGAPVAAAASRRTGGTGPRLVLLLAGDDGGEVTVVVAE